MGSLSFTLVQEGRQGAGHVGGRARRDGQPLAGALDEEVRRGEEELPPLAEILVVAVGDHPRPAPDGGGLAGEPQADVHRLAGHDLLADDVLRDGDRPPEDLVVVRDLVDDQVPAGVLEA